MELVTVPLELVKEAAVEATKETVKALETADEFGKLGIALESEEIHLRNTVLGECGKQISFGSLADGAFKTDVNYLRWKDGIDVGEVKPEWIEELANEIAAIYGNDHLTADTKYIDFSDGIPYRFDNAAIDAVTGEIVYDPKYLRDNGNVYGMDNIIGTIAHEVGHRVVYNTGLLDEIIAHYGEGEEAIKCALYEGEACADYIAGLTTRLCKLNGTHKLSWYNATPDVSMDGVHPGKSVRMETFIRGFDRIERGEEATILKTFEAFSPYDLEGVYKDADLMRKVLYEDVINPLRNGEIKKV